MAKETSEVLRKAIGGTIMDGDPDSEGKVLAGIYQRQKNEELLNEKRDEIRIQLKQEQVSRDQNLSFEQIRYTRQEIERSIEGNLLSLTDPDVIKTLDNLDLQEHFTWIRDVEISKLWLRRFKITFIASTVTCLMVITDGLLNNPYLFSEARTVVGVMSGMTAFMTGFVTPVVSSLINRPIQSKELQKRLDRALTKT